MLTVVLTVIALAVACVIVWIAARRTRIVQRVSGNLSGPVEQMQEQILLTADTAVDRLDGKIAQMEILLAEIDRRSTVLVQQSKQQQMNQLQIEQQQQQLVVWLQTQRQNFDKEFQQAETAMDGVKIKVPDVLSDEYCDVCGRQMVVKKGKFGYFLGCPGFPECTFTKPIVVEMPGKCPRCGGKILKRSSKKGYVFYACERGTDCGFITWDVPTKDFCPACGKTMFKHSGRGPLKSFCINEECVNFVPEDKRVFKKKTPEEKAAAEEKKAATAAKKAETAEKKSAAAKKPAAKKPATCSRISTSWTAKKPRKALKT